MNFDTTMMLLESVIGTPVLVYPALDDPSRNDEPDPNFQSGLSTWGILKRDKDVGAESRRRMSTEGLYASVAPDLDLGNAPLEMYERQLAGFTFEGMDKDKQMAAFVLWEREFRESRWLQMGFPFDLLWIRRKQPLGLVVGGEFPDAP